MKIELLYRELKELAEKLGIRVLEQNFRTTGIHVKSGYCKVKGKDHFVIDKHLRLINKAEAIGEYLASIPTDSIYIVPVVREFLDRLRPHEHPRRHPSGEDPIGADTGHSTETDAPGTARGTEKRDS